MQHRLSAQMLKSLEQIKRDSVSLFDSMEVGEQKRITLKATKHKTLTASLLKVKNPTFGLYVNGKYYGLFYLKNGKWEVDK